MRFKKTIVTLSSFAMLCGSIVPSAAFASDVPKTVKQLDVKVASNQSHILKVKSSELTEEIVQAGETITKYIKLGEDNLYYIDPAAEPLYSSEVYQSYSRAVDSVNDAIDQKLLKIENGEPVANIEVAQSSSNIDSFKQAANKKLLQNTNANSTSLSFPQKSIEGAQKYVFANLYWWGVAVTFNNQETIDQVYQLNQSGQVWVLVAVVGGAIAVVNPPVGLSASAAATIVAVGSFMIANSMSHNNKGRGVTLNLH
ncbi:hypothetical protein [Paenibacillus sp. FSL H8-0537]|uniref:hypothetical protein n=1 Tax=Paenibacillus sp. FSL H8-0537 TaxID=2921399 RepID=UPI003100FFE6